MEKFYYKLYDLGYRGGSDISKRYIKYLFIVLGFISILISCSRSNANNEKINIYEVVKEAFITDKGYSDELSKHISEEVFDKINIYSVYEINNCEYSKPFNVDFTLNENSQEVKKDMIYVNMNYSVIITDSQVKEIGGSKNVPITFTINKTENNWYIIDKDEPA